MDPFTALALVTAATGAISSLYGNGGSDPPNLPTPSFPDADVLKEYSSYTDWQNKLRSQLLAQYYGGRATNAPIDYGKGGNQNTDFSGPYSGMTDQQLADAIGVDKEIIDAESRKSLEQSDMKIPTNRWETVFTGEKPARMYNSSQKAILRDSAAGHKAAMSDYFAQRGIKDSGGGIASGAEGELKETYDQRSREIAAKSQDIYLQTLATLFPEVSDYGAQAAQAAARIGMESQMENQYQDMAYQNEMQKWQIAQSMPPSPMWNSIGQTLGMLGYLGGGSPAAAGGMQLSYSPQNQFGLMPGSNYWPSPVFGLGR